MLTENHSNKNAVSAARDDENVHILSVNSPWRGHNGVATGVQTVAPDLQWPKPQNPKSDSSATPKKKLANQTKFAKPKKCLTMCIAVTSYTNTVVSLLT